MANHDEKQSKGMKAAYRIVPIPIAASLCRNCAEPRCAGKLRCSHLLSVRNDLLSEMSSYGVAENNYWPQAKGSARQQF